MPAIQRNTLERRIDQHGERPHRHLRHHNFKRAMIGRPIFHPLRSRPPTLFSLCYDFHLHVAINNPPCVIGTSTGDNEMCSNPEQLRFDT
jgi:hypothetical protein